MNFGCLFTNPSSKDFILNKWKNLWKLEKDKEIGQDDSKKYQEEIETLTANKIKIIDEVQKSKEEDLKNI